MPMDGMLRFPSSVRHDQAIDLWLRAQRDELRQLMEPWFAQMRRSGADVRERAPPGSGRQRKGSMTVTRPYVRPCSKSSLQSVSMPSSSA